MTAVGFILEYRLKAKLKTYLTHEALILANVIATMVPQTEKPVILDSFCRKYADITDVRVTIIRTDGSVIGESDRSSIGVDNHLKKGRSTGGH
jgi:GTP-sensing pleiotropic transcriptional regulator CodY